jgi:hypothetical protein
MNSNLQSVIQRVNSEFPRHDTYTRNSAWNIPRDGCEDSHNRMSVDRVLLPSVFYAWPDYVLVSTSRL